MIEIARGDIALSLAPEVGGSVSALRCAGHDVLRPASAADLRAASVLGMAAFPLVPFAGRIDHGRFEFQGQRVRLPADLPGEPHAIHGQGWQRPWQVVSHSATTARLRYEHEAGAWPWHYRASQTFRVLDGGVRLDLTLQNRSDSPMPAGLGWHPYFVRPAGTRLRADVTGIWRRSADMLPAAPAALDEACDLTSWHEVDALDLDDVFTAGDGAAEIRWSGVRATVRGRPAAFLVVYAPPGQPWFCVEPISHVPNALNGPATAASGLRVLEPGAIQAARIELELRAAP